MAALSDSTAPGAADGFLSASYFSADLPGAHSNRKGGTLLLPHLESPGLLGGDIEAGKKRRLGLSR